MNEEYLKECEELTERYWKENQLLLKKYKDDGYKGLDGEADREHGKLIKRFNSELNKLKEKYNI